jgi:hypothetical protein
MLLGQPARRGICRTSGPCRFADARRSLSPQRRSRTGKSIIHRPRTASLSIGRKPRRSSAQVSPVATATHDAAHCSRNHALHRPPRSSARQSLGGRTGIARATPPRRNIEARRDLRRSDQRRRDLAERAIEAKGDGYVCSREVNGVQSPALKCNCVLGLERVGKAVSEPPCATGCGRPILLKKSPTAFLVRFLGVFLPLTGIRERFMERSERSIFSRANCKSHTATFSTVSTHSRPSGNLFERPKCG